MKILIADDEVVVALLERDAGSEPSLVAEAATAVSNSCRWWLSPEP